ncbi:MAG: transposase [Blautia sp.]
MYERKTNTLKNLRDKYQLPYGVVGEIPAEEYQNQKFEEYLQELVQQIAEDKGFTVHLFECGEGDHVHCLIQPR